MISLVSNPESRRLTEKSNAARLSKSHSATMTIRAFALVAPQAASNVRWLPAQSMTMSTPPPVASRTALTTSVSMGLRTRSAPQAVAIAPRVAVGSETATKEAPRAFRTLRVRRKVSEVERRAPWETTHRVTSAPIGPAPITRAVSPFLRPLHSTACHATDRGSARAASSTARELEGQLGAQEEDEGSQRTSNIVWYDVQVGLRDVAVRRKSACPVPRRRRRGNGRRSAGIHR